MEMPWLGALRARIDTPVAQPHGIAYETQHVRLLAFPLADGQGRLGADLPIQARVIGRMGVPHDADAGAVANRDAGIAGRGVVRLAGQGRKGEEEGGGGEGIWRR